MRIPVISSVGFILDWPTRNLTNVRKIATMGIFLSFVIFFSEESMESFDQIDGPYAYQTPTKVWYVVALYRVINDRRVKTNALPSIICILMHFS